MKVLINQKLHKKDYFLGENQRKIKRKMALNMQKIGSVIKLFCRKKINVFLLEQMMNLLDLITWTEM